MKAYVDTMTAGGGGDGPECTFFFNISFFHFLMSFCIYLTWQVWWMDWKVARTWTGGLMRLRLYAASLMLLLMALEIVVMAFRRVSLALPTFPP
jgi:hypothetical protein